MTTEISNEREGETVPMLPTSNETLRPVMVGVVAALLIGEMSDRARAMQAQPAPPVEFDVVSIKRNTGGRQGGGLRMLPDGTFMMTNQPIRVVILRASPVSAREVVGLPDWAMDELYDMVAKPPAGSTRDQWGQMWQAVFAERMKLRAHVEERERDTFTLVGARSDGRLGPRLKPSALDCAARLPDSAPPPPRQGAHSVAESQNSCGIMMGVTSLVSGGATLDHLAASLSGVAGGLVKNGTGLEGNYAFTLTFSRRSSPSASAATDSLGDPPDIFSALPEQLGLKLQRQKSLLPILVIDHIERPTEN